MLMKNKFQSMVAKAPQNTGGGNSQHCVLQYESAQCYKDVRTARFLWNKKDAATVSAEARSEAQGSMTLEECRGNHPVITPLSPRNHPLLSRVWKYVACMLLAFILGIGQMWADTEYKLIDYTQTTPAKNADFGTSNNVSQFSTAIKFTEADESETEYTHYIALPSKVIRTFSSGKFSGQTADAKQITYDIKTTSASVKIYAYSKESSSKKQLFVGRMGECRIDVDTIDITAKQALIVERTIENCSNGSRLVISGNSTNLQIAQVIVTETGTALPVVGEEGYQITGNRVAVVKETDYLFNGLTIYASSDVKCMDGYIAQFKVNSSKPQGYVKFTTPNNGKNILMTLSYEESKGVVVDAVSSLPTSLTGYSALSNKVTESKHKLNPNTTYFIFSCDGTVKLKSVSFSIPKVTYDANGGSGTMAATEWTVDENGFTAPEGKKFDKWTTSQDGTGTDVVKAVGAEVTENTTLYAQWKADVEEYAITEATSLTGGSVDASAATEAAGETVTITATPAFRYLFGAWDVYKTGDPTTKVSVTETAGVYTFEMPAYPVTVSASFTADGRKQILYLTTAATGSDKLYAALNADATYNVIVEAPASQTLTNYDLVVLHESLDGKNAASGILHNVATAAVPVLNTKSYFYNNANTTDQRWNWGTPNNGDAAQKVATLNTSYSNIADHPIFDGVTITANTVKVLTDDVTSGNTMQPIGIFTTGKEGYTLATTPNKEDNPTPDGCAIHELTPTQRGVDSGKYLMISVSNAGLNNLTADGQKLFKNAAAYLLDSEAAWVPAAAATDDATLKALSVSGLTLSPTFAAATVNYTITKAYGADDPAESDVTATPTADGASAEVEWDETNKKFVITVTAVDNTTTKEYTITVNEAAAPKSLSRVLFSNGFDAFIDNTNHTVKAYYLAGATAPTATTITAGAGTAGEYAEGKITVTGDDASTVDYIVTLEAVTPNTTTVAEEAAAGEFAGDEAWVKNGLLISGTAAGFNADGKYYVNRRLLKSGDAAEDQRVIAGWVRSYFFVGNAYKFIMTVSNNNAIKYSVDGGEQVASNAATVEITLPAGNHMIEIVSNQSSGDCRLSAPKLVERPATYTVTYTAGEGTGNDVTDDFEYAAGDEVTVQENAFTAPANKKFNGWASAPAVTISEGKFEMPASNVVLTAQWKEYFTITYMDGEDVLGTEEVFTDATPAGIAYPSKVGYDFAGWVDGEDNPVTIASLSATTIVYAKWTVFDGCVMLKPAKTGDAISANDAIAMQEGSFGATMKALTDDLSYDTNGLLFGNNSGTKAEVTLSSNTLKAGTVITAVIYNHNDDKARGLSLLTKDGASVANVTWTATVVGTHTETYTVQADDGLEGTNAFQLKREQNAYLQSIKITNCGAEPVTVTFKSADETLIAEEVIEKGTKVVAPAAPHVSGKRFIGWSETKNDAESLVNLTTTDIDADVTYYAVYEDVVCPTEGTVFSMAITDPAGTEYEENNNFGLEIGATYVGGKAYSGAKGTTKRVGVIDENGEYAFTNNGDVTIKIAMDCALQEGDVITFTTSTTRELKIQKVAGTDLVTTSGKKYTIPAESQLIGLDEFYLGRGNSESTFKTFRIDRPYTISFDMQEHGAAIAAQKLLAGEKVAEPAAPTADGYDFFGWYKEAACTNAWDFDEDLVSASATLYAKWDVHRADIATLKSLKYGDTDIVLEDGVYEYNIELPALMAAVPALSAVATSTTAHSVNIVNASAFDEDGKATSKVVVTAEDEVTTQTYWVHFTKAASVALQDVTGSITWDFSKSGITAETNIPSETVMANIPAVNNDENFWSDKIQAGAGKLRVGYYQGGKLMFHTTVPGLLKVEFSNTGSSARPYRELLVNGNPTGAKSKDNTHVIYTVAVKSGDIELTARIYDNDGNPTANTSTLNFYLVDFDADLSDNAITEDAFNGYNRDVTEGQYGTICLPNGGVMVGAAIFEVAYMTYQNNAPYKVFFDEVLSGEMVAGRPYIFMPNEDAEKIAVFYTDNANADAGYYRGLHGTYNRIEGNDLYGKYIFYNNTIFMSENQANWLNANRAYIVLSEVQDYETPASAGRRRVSMGVNAPAIATDLENVQGGNVQATKVLIDGQLYILRGEKMYDAKGQLVK